MEELDILPLLGTVIYPMTVTPIAVTQPAALRLLDSPDGAPRRVGILTLRAPGRRPAQPRLSDCFSVGTVALVHRLLRLPDGTLRVAVEGLERFEALEELAAEPTLQARVRPLAEPEPELGLEELAGRLRSTALDLAARSPAVSRELLDQLVSEDDQGRICFLIAAAILPHRPLAERQAVLEAPDLATRLARLAQALDAAALALVAEPSPPPVAPPPPPPAEPGRALWLRHTADGPAAAWVEAALMPGAGGLTVTGQRGRAAREAASLAWSWARVRAAHLDGEGEGLARSDVHLHLAPGASPEAPAAGGAAALALASLTSRRPAAPGTAICGDISLHGRLLPVARPAELVAAARRLGLSAVALAAEQRPEVEPAPPGLRLIFVERLHDALPELLAEG